MPVAPLAELIEKNYTGDVEWLESISSSFVLEKVEENTATVSTPLPKKNIAQEIVAIDLDDPKRKLTKEEAMLLKQWEKDYMEALAYVKDMIAPSMMRIDATKLQIGDTFVRTIFTYAYPDVLEGNWLSPLINWDVKFDVSMFVYPVDSADRKSVV